MILDRQEPVSLAANVFTKSGPIDRRMPWATNSGYIVSIHFNPIHFENAYLNFSARLRPVFHKDIVNSTISVAEIRDMVEMVRIGDIEAPKLHRGIDIARSLVSDYFNALLGVDLVGNCYPGVGVSETEEPSDSFMQKLLVAQQNYCNMLIDQGTVYNARNEQNRITDDHRKAADYMNVSTVWKPKPHSLQDQMECLGCGNTIKSVARICMHCGAPQDRTLFDTWFNNKIMPQVQIQPQAPIPIPTPIPVQTQPQAQSQPQTQPERDQNPPPVPEGNKNKSR